MEVSEVEAYPPVTPCPTCNGAAIVLAYLPISMQDGTFRPFVTLCPDCKGEGGKAEPFPAKEANP